MGDAGRSIWSGRGTGILRNLLVSILLVVTVSPLAQSAGRESLDQLLKRVVLASETQDYYGKIFYARAEEPEKSVTLAHSGKGPSDREVIKGPLGNEVEMVWDAGQLSLYVIRATGQVRMAKLTNPPILQSLTAAQRASIVKNYNLRWGAPTEVAKRKADFVILTPKNNDRYEYRAWIDTKTGVLLGALRRNEAGVTAEQFYFTEFYVGSRPKKSGDEYSRLIADGKRAEPLAIDAKSEIAKRWTVGYLPDGFVEVAQVHRSVGRLAGTDQWVFSDGLNTVSIFFKKLDKAWPDAIIAQRRGSTGAAVRHSGGFEIIVIGEVPVHTATQIVSSVKVIKP